MQNLTRRCRTLAGDTRGLTVPEFAFIIGLAMFLGVVGTNLANSNRPSVQYASSFSFLTR